MQFNLESPWQKAARTIVKLAATLVLVAAVESSRISGAVNQWTSLGPEGGTINRLVVDPQNPNTAYVTTQGIFKTTDGGKTWKAASSGLPGAPINALAIDSQNPGTLYAGSGSGSSRMFKSTDGGENWQALSSWPAEPRAWPYALAVDPQDPSTVYAGICGGILKSADGGATWASTVFRERGNCVHVLTIDPRTPSTLYAGLAAERGSGGGLFKSTDGGQTWSAALLPESAYIGAVAIDPQYPSRVYTLLVRNRDDYCFAQCSWVVSSSADGGASWVDSALPDGFAGALAFDLQDPSAMYAAAGGGIFRSTDGGTSWELVNPALTSDHIRPLAVDPQNPAILYAAGNRGDGLFKSMDGGRSWNSINSGLKATWAGSLAIDSQNSSTIYAAIQGRAWKSRDRGASWNAMEVGSRSTGLPARTRRPEQPLHASFLAVDPQNPSILYAWGTGGFLKSTDAGATWNRLDLGIQNTYPMDAPALDPQNPGTLYVAVGSRDECWWGYGVDSCRGGVLKSTDGGATWVNSELPYDVWSVAIDPRNPNTLYAGGFGGAFGPFQAVVKSTDGGMNWTAIYNARSWAGRAGSLAINPQDPNTVYVYGPAVLKTTNGGRSWSDASSGLTADVRALVIYPQTPSTIYAGTYGGGVFRSRDGGATWATVNSGLTSLAVDSLALDPQDPNTLYAGTVGGGVFVITFGSQ